MSSKKKYPKLTTAKIEERLIEGGIKPTAQRIAVCQFVLSKPIHPTVEEVKKWVDRNFPKMSLATVYNTLNALAEAKILKPLKFSHTDKVMFDNNTETHYHFLDEETGNIYDIPAEDLTMDLKLSPDFEVDDVEVLIRGKIKEKAST